jgi:S-DNA-T family DNA segregation ATPase FtsK/SpoIIIE
MADNDRSTAPLIPARRKKEVLGLILIALAVLLSLALLTWDPADRQIAASFSVEAVISPGDADAQNALGHLGAALASALVPGFLGYTMLAVTGLVGVWGYVVLRRRRPRALPLLTVLTGTGTFLAACLLGWFGQTLGANLLPWGGRVGLGVAGWMQRVLGAVGSLIVLGVLFGVTVLLAVDHDLQRSMDRLETGLRALRERGAAFFAAVSTRWRTFREERQKRRAERRQEREEQRQQREAGRAPEERPGAPAPQEQTSSPRRDAPGDEETSSAHSLPTRRQNAGGSMRLNEMYRPGTAPASSGDASQQQPSSPEAPSQPPQARQARQRPEDPRQRSSPGSSSESPSEPPSEPAAEPASAPAPDPDPAPDAPPAERTSAENGGTNDEAPSGDEPREVAMKVQEQVEEETADDLSAGASKAGAAPFTLPALDLLDDKTESDEGATQEELEENKRTLLDKLGTYDVEIESITAVVGPTVTRYELLPAPGVKVSRIKNLEDDLAMAMAAPSIRVIAPIPGKKAVGVEIPNRNRELVRLRGVLGTKKFRDSGADLPVAMGKSIEGEVFIEDLATMPHLLIAGATGAGKSVGLNAMLTGLIYARHPDDLKFVLIDPKKIELRQYSLLADHYIASPEDVEDPVITDFEKAQGVFESCEKEMEERYDLLAKAGVRSITGYNEKFDAGELPEGEGHRRMPFLVVVVDELADLMMTAGSEIEGPIARLAQMARAVGIHLVLATQRPSVDVITGIIKANFPSRMAYQVASRVDSRTILDQGGAEGLVGNGDLLYIHGSNLKRLQGPFVSVDEVDRVTEAVADQEPREAYTLPSLEDEGELDTLLGVDETDELFEEAAHVIVRGQRGSVSLLQRKLSVGYTRAARIVDQLEEVGIVGAFAGTKAREVMVDDEEELERLLAGEDLSEEGNDGGTGAENAEEEDNVSEES